MQHLQENGSYNQLYPKVDSYSKNETLTNNTSQMFRIDNGTPEDVFKWLRKYNQHEWKKVETQNVWSEQLTVQGSGDSYTTDLFLCKSIAVENESKIFPVNPKYFEATSVKNCCEIIVDYAPCYVWLFWQRANGGISNVDLYNFYYVPEGATWSSGRPNSVTTTLCYYKGSDDDESYYLLGNKNTIFPTKIVKGSNSVTSNTSYLFDSDKTKYPESFSSKNDSWEIRLNDPITFTNSVSGKLYYADNYSFNGSNYSWSDVSSISLSKFSSRTTDLNVLKGKYMSFDNANSLFSKMTYYIPEAQGSLSATGNTFTITGQIVSFTYKGNNYYTLEYKGIPFENLKELTV